MRRLTPKQERFAQKYVETSNASEAYRQAYDVSPSTSAQVIAVKACELLKSGNVAVRVAELTAASAARHAITIDSLTEMLKEDRALAHKVEEPGAAINAVLAMGKLHGLVIEKRNVNSDNRHHHSAETVSAFDEFLRAATGAGSKDEASETIPN